jgi:hypothetical protein
MAAIAKKIDVRKPSPSRTRRISFCHFRVVVSNVPAHAIICPHCKKPFDGELLAEGSRHEGFKCPHCRLFVPVERANGDDGASS